MDKYTYNLMLLAELKVSEYVYANRLPTEKEIQHNSKRKFYSAWLRELMKSIQPVNPEQEIIRYHGESDDVFRTRLDAKKMPKIRYENPKIIAKGGEAILVRCNDLEESRVVLVKFALPKKGLTEEKPKEVKKNAILRGGQKLLDVVYNRRPDERRSLETTAVKRFSRSILIQKKLRENIEKKGLLEYGYIPRIYYFQDATINNTKQYAIMEYIEGQSLLAWLENKTLNDRLKFFLKLLYAIEKLLHNFSIIHCDIKPHNILVLNNKPVILDFGLSFSTRVMHLTQENEPSGFGSPLYAPQEQFDTFIERNELEDIFSLGRLLWVIYNAAEPDTKQRLCVNSEGEFDFREITTLFPSSIFEDDLRRIFEKAIDARADRYSDIADFRREFELYLSRFFPATNCNCEKNLKQLINLILEVLQ